MQSKEMYDYRLAFAMFGALNGFANLTRDFTDIIYSRDKNYIAEIYKEFHGQLFGINPIIEYVEQKNEEKFHDNKSITDLSTKKANETGSDEISSLVNTLIIKCKGAEKDKHIYAKYFREYGMSKELLKAIEENKSLNNGKPVQKTIISWIEKEISSKNKKQKKQPNQESVLFVEEKPQEGSEFYKDRNALTYLADLLPNDKKVRKQFKTDMEWFQENHNEIYIDSKGKQQGCYYNKPTDNQSVIERFKKYLENKQTSTGPNKEWLRTIYKSINIPAIIFKLKELYK